MDDEDLESLKQQTNQGDRLDDAAENQQSQPIGDAILAELEAIDREGRQKTVSVWDGPMTALIAALENHPREMERVAAALQAELDIKQEETPDRSDVLRMALRLGFATAAPDLLDATRNAVQNHASQNL